MNREHVMREAERHCKLTAGWMFDQPGIIAFWEAAFAAGAAAERNSAAEISGDFARKWWSLHCATNKHMETTLMAHNDFCALQSAIRARGEK